MKSSTRIDFQKSSDSKPKSSLMLGLMITLFTSVVSVAQVTTNGGSGLSATYPDLASAITALNAATITSPVVITLDPSTNQTAPAGGYSITAQGTAVNTIIIDGNFNTVTAPTPQTSGQLYDAIFKLVGADYVTIQKFTMMENAANTTTAAGTNNMTEWGVAILYASTTNGAQNNTIQNNVIDLDRTYQNTFGIYSNSTHAAGTPTTSATATSTTGGNHGLKVYTNTIQDVNIGVLVIGPTAAADHNDGVDIGGNALASGNTITNYGTTGTFSAYANVSGSVNGILVRNTKNFNVSYNSIASSNGGVTAGTLRGIFIPTFPNAPTGTVVNTINNNSVSLRSANATGAMLGISNEATTANATTTLNINNNDFNTFGHTIASSGAITLIINAAASLNNNINGNTFTNLSVNTTGGFIFISNNLTHPANSVNNVNNNAIVTAFSKTGAGGTVYFYDSFGSSTSGTEINTGNIFSNVTLTGATTLGGFRTADGATPFPAKTVTNNVFNNIIVGTSTSTVLNVGYSTATVDNVVSGNVVSNVSGAAAITGITSPAGSQNFFGNNVFNITSTAGATVSAISITGGITQKVYKNKIYNVEANNAAGVVNGILVSSGTTVNLYNNIIGDLRTPSSNLANPLNGINITGGTNVNAYYNTVMLNASSTGALFGSSAISAATGPTVELRNNIFVNNSNVTGAGLATAYRRSTTTLTSYATASNNNLFYGSTIFTDGTNTDATFGAFQTRVATRDAASISVNPTFTSTIGSNGQFLHIDTATPTLIEGGGANIATYTDDFDGDVRNGSTPDIGADEFAGTPIPTVVINNVAITPLGNQCTAVSRNVTANITAGGNDITSVTLNYSFNGVAQTPIAMTGGTLTAGSTSTFSATIPVASPVNANVTWSVVAVDPLVNKSTSGTAYQDEPLFGASATASASVPVICNSGSTELIALLTKNGTKDLGAGALTTSGSGTLSTNYVSPFTHYYGGYKAQYLIRASELTAMGLSAGNVLNSLAFDVTTVGASATYTGFTVGIGYTAANVLTTTFDTSSVTQVYTGNLNVPAIGLLTLPFGTGAGSTSSLVWDGTSNVLVNICWSNNNGGGAAAGSAEVKYDVTSFVAMSYFRVDNQSQATVCGTTTATGTLSNRPKMILGGNFAPAITNYSWSDGSTVVGTGNNLLVSPTVTTTYTATLTAAGCTIATNSVVVTVNNTAAPTGASPQSFNAGQTLADLVVTGSNIVWYASASDAASAINPLPTSTLLVDNTTYYATQTVSSCPSTASLAVLAQIALNTNGFDLSKFKFYPNPVHDILNVDYAQNISKVEVFNAVGQLVSVKCQTGVSTKVNMSGLSDGVYLVKLSSENSTQVIRVVKN